MEPEYSSTTQMSWVVIGFPFASAICPLIDAADGRCPSIPTAGLASVGVTAVAELALTAPL